MSYGKDRQIVDVYKWPEYKPMCSGRYLVWGYEEPYSKDIRSWVTYYSTMYGWDANPKIVAWTPIPVLPNNFINDRSHDISEQRLGPRIRHFNI